MKYYGSVVYIIYVYIDPTLKALERQSLHLAY